MLVMLATALIGDMILLPALLAGPAGRWFKCNHQKKSDPDLGNASEILASDEAHFDSIDTSEPDTFVTEERSTSSLPESLELPEGTEDPLPKLRLHFPTDTQSGDRRRVSGK
jgi:hypothetical protein